MIKQIQLRGISHRPSDRLTADGGLEDCIDLRLEEEEHASAKAPENVTDTLAPGLSETGIDVTYIHKTNSYTNYIGVLESGGHKYLCAYMYDETLATWGSQQILQLPGDEYPKDITSVGNILVVALEDGPLYLLHKDSSYVNLGREIPFPKVFFSTETDPTQGSAFQSIPIPQRYPTIYSNFGSSSPKVLWDYVISVIGQTDGGLMDEANALYNDVVSSLWAAVDAAKRDTRDNGTFTCPILARYAVRLYDGSYIHISSPVLLFGYASNANMSVRSNILNASGVGVNVGAMQIWGEANNTFKAKYSALADQSLAQWSDIVDSIDVFISTDIMVPRYGSKLGAATETGSHGTAYNYSDITFAFDGADADDRVEFEKQMLLATNFYRIASVPIDKVATGVDEYITPKSQDDLVVLPRLSEGNPHFISGISDVGTYNSRLVLAGERVHLSLGHRAPVAMLPPSGVAFNPYVTTIFYVKTETGSIHIVKSYSDYRPHTESQMRGYISYPDARCIRAEMYIESGAPATITKVTLPMKEHPNMNVAYGFWGLDSAISDTNMFPDDSRSTEIVTEIPGDDPVLLNENRLRLSELDNPFFFSLGQGISFTARIISAVPVTTALSTGQFGQFPLYVFTEDGIWTVSLNDEGGIVASHPVSRDVAKDGTVAQLDQAIVFVSEQGVMLLSGSQTSLLSPYMDGPRFDLESVLPDGSTIRAALSVGGWGNLIDISLDATNFREFIDGCRPLYDYENRRILFLNPEENYAYEYALDSQTWHRLSIPGTFVRTLNGYPKALAIMDGEIFDWSVRYEYNATNPQSRKGIILTRSMDLGEPDIRKVVHDLRIRGTFNRGDIKYLMFGSSDGIHWQRLLTKGGGSYNLFRFLILANLSPGERISWIDVDYERRFANKLR